MKSVVAPAAVSLVHSLVLVATRNEDAESGVTTDFTDHTDTESEEN